MRTFVQKPKAAQQTTPTKSTIPGRAHCGQSREVSSILHLQRTIRNQAPTEDVKGVSNTTQSYRFGNNSSRIPVYSKVPFKIQSKLTVSKPNDRYEQEADRVADSVMAGYTRPIGNISQGVQPKLYRVELRPEDTVDSMFPPKGEHEFGSPERASAEEVQRSASGETGAVTPHFEQALQQATYGQGETLPSSTRSFMESRFDRDFSSVRVHSDARAHTLAREINARAFTLDKHIFFAGSQYQPGSREGQRLLAHELTHVLQQSDGRLSRQIQRQTSCSRYNGYNSSVNLRTYNCAGLATWTYQFIAPTSAVYDSILANFIGPYSPAEDNCDAGAVKFWLWEYDLHLEDDRGTVLSPNHQDFHIVAGRTGANGANPTDVYSKNGRRRVYGPGTGPGFRPPTRSRALSNDPSETPATYRGRPVFKVRSNMSEAISCAECYP
ncbi:DUF4157 domain-containing protein [Desulfobacter curvatus]|uniref:eCIS core domain-containing protein n=1 Tax=Desulfobacter curvatus TaxID=2290 RepID=UPI0003620EF8|nr:DUF4157 domain-containing protein [Desulfobacter curvatus]